MEQKKLSRNRKPVGTGKLAATDLTADFGAMLVESSPDALIALADHTVLFWNSGAEAIFGTLRKKPRVTLYVIWLCHPSSSTNRASRPHANFLKDKGHE